MFRESTAPPRRGSRGPGTCDILVCKNPSESSCHSAGGHRLCAEHHGLFHEHDGRAKHADDCGLLLKRLSFKVGTP